MTEHLCIVCPQLRPGEPRHYERPHVCDGCRARLAALLVELVDYYGDLDLVKATGGGAKVSGSRTPPLPLAVRPLDLTMPPRPAAVQDDLRPVYTSASVTVPVWEPARPGQAYAKADVTMRQRQRARDTNGWLAYGPSGDQIGDVSVLNVLDSWARDWQTHHWATLPEPAVPALAAWLGDRLEWACDHHPAVDDFAAELSALVGKLRPPRIQPDLKACVPCRQCDTMALYQWPGSDRIECGSCTALMTIDEYARWTGLTSTPEWRTWMVEVGAAQTPPKLPDPKASAPA